MRIFVLFRVIIFCYVSVFILATIGAVGEVTRRQALRCYLFIYYENRIRGTQEIIKLNITESLQMKQKVHSANSEQRKPKSLKLHR